MRSMWGRNDNVSLEVDQYLVKLYFLVKKKESYTTILIHYVIKTETSTTTIT